MQGRGRRYADGANRLKRLAAFTILQAVSFGTPVDTGRARANWLVDLGKPAEGTVGSQGARPADAPDPLAAGRATIDRSEPEQSIHVTNNLPYINELNEGSSAQAPAGFVQLAVSSAVAAIRGRRLED